MKTMHNCVANLELEASWVLIGILAIVSSTLWREESGIRPSPRCRLACLPASQIADRFLKSCDRHTYSRACIAIKKQNPFSEAHILSGPAPSPCRVRSAAVYNYTIFHKI
jgi:hypothetical protein